MTNKIKSFFAYFCFCVFTTRLEREIFHRIFPHLNGEKDHGCPFNWDQELWKQRHHGNLEVLYRIELIESQADHMGKAYGEAFRYIMYRNLNACLLPYVKLAQWRVPSALRIARYVE